MRKLIDKVIDPRNQKEQNISYLVRGVVLIALGVFGVLFILWI